MKWEIYGEAEAGLWFRNTETNDTIFLTWKDIQMDALIKRIRKRIADEWPAKWIEIKKKLPIGFVDEGPREPRNSAIEDVGDLYWLTKVDLLQMPGVGPANADKLVKSIGQSKWQPLYKVLYGLGIRHVGEGAAKVLSKHFKTIEELGYATYSDFYTIEGIGPTIVDSIMQYFKQERNWRVIDKMIQGGVDSLTGYTGEEQPSPLKGKNILFTGALQHMTRIQAQALVERLGGTSCSSLTKNTDYLVVGERPGSKLVRAALLGIPNLTEEDFLKMTKEVTT